jgi:WD40 repeat protein
MVIVLGVVFVFASQFGARYAADAWRPSAAVSMQAPVQDVVNSPLPAPHSVPPTQEIIVITPPPDGGVIVLPPAKPGQIYAFPSPTPFPTWTPRPTPTRRPGPTATAMPLPKPADTAQGHLLYAVPSMDPFNHIWMLSQIDETGRLAPDSATTLKGIVPSLTYAQPSPTGAYILFLQPNTAAGVPYIYELFNQRVHPLFDHPKQFEEYGVEGFEQITGLPFGWHPDGKHVLFWVWTAPDAGLWLVNVETGERTIIKIHRDPPPRGAAISPDGQRIAYAINNADVTHIEIAFTDGVLDKSIESIQINQLFGWSPDGKYLLVSNNVNLKESVDQANGVNEGPLWLLDPLTQSLQPLQIPFIANWPFQANWSPNSRFVAAVGLTPGARFKCFDKGLPPEKADSCMYEGTSIYVQDITTGKVRELTSGILPTWSPDGSQLAFLSAHTGTPEVWTIHADGTDLQQITDDGTGKSFSLTWIGQGEVNK